MNFKVLASGRFVPPRSPEPLVALVENNWDDYGYRTTFAAIVVTESGSTDLGSVKVLRADQHLGPTPIEKEFTQLSEDYCSLGQTQSYYELLKSLGDNICSDVLLGLRDAATNAQILTEFEHLEGFRNSLIRNSTARRVLIDIPVFFQSANAANPDDQPGNQVAVEFLTTVGGNRFPFTLNFASGGEIPGRISVIIGYNGSGKTRLLANIAMLTATPANDRIDERFTLQYGQIVHNFFFGGTFAVSFSAFDDFELPGRNSLEKKGVSERQEEYIYCGLRRLKSDDIEDILSESDRQIRLKSSREILDSFEQALRKIQDSERRKSFVEALTPLTMEPSFAGMNLLSALTQSDDEPLQFFKYLSTGHKIIINVITQMTAYLQKKSLVLFDEPEAHLHPPLLATLLKSLRIILDRADSFCLMATHSPVVLQETPKRYVQIIRRNGPKTHILSPQVETFGENVGTLTHEVFNLDSSKTDFHDILATLAMDKKMSEIEQLFGNPLGFQARSYLLGLGVKEE